MPLAIPRMAQHSDPRAAETRQPPARWWKLNAPQRTDLLCVLPFLALFFVQLAHHQLWRDELNAWGLAAASHNLRQLFFYIHYEAHPGLWYVLLWSISRLTTSPVLGLKLLQAVIGSAIYLVIALKAPFTRSEKVLLYLSYFVSFEYTVFSRMYGLLFLLVLLYTHKRVTQPDRILLSAVLLGIMANTDTLGVLLSFALIAENVFAWTHQEIAARLSKRRVVVAGAIYSTALLLSYLTLRPSKHISWRTTGHIFAYARDPGYLFFMAVRYIVLPWFPLDPRFPHVFWDPTPISSLKLFYICMLPVVVGLVYWLFRRDRSLLVLQGVAAVTAILFAHLIYQGWMRHYGIVFMAFLVALWIQRYRRPQVPVLSYAFLGLSALGGIGAGIAQWNHPFSNAGAAAHWIRDHHLENEPLIGTVDTSVAGVAELLRRPIYFLECNCTDTFLLFSDRRDSYSKQQMPSRLAIAAHSIKAPQAVFITTYPLTAAQMDEIQRRSLQLKPLAAFPGAEDPEENYYLYSLSQTPHMSVSQSTLNLK